MIMKGDRMNPLPQMVSVADIKNHHLKVFAMLKNGPVVIASRSKPAAVIISPDQWDAIAEELDILWTEREAALAELRIATGRSKVVEMSEHEIEHWLAEDEAVPA
jgi:prevent-host-death family protein